MLFNSLAFAVFLPLAFAGYWALSGKLRSQNLFILIASYVFYGWWDWRFLFLIAFSSAIDYCVGLGLSRTESQGWRRVWLGLSLSANLGLLGLFKYFDFFADSFARLLGTVGLEASWVTLGLVLPVGISFYTFQTLSYTLDVYRRKLEPTRDFIVFFAYVSFFPQLVAGPIERATQLLPQFQQNRTFVESEAVAGLRQILWGLFKKVAVADTCGVVVDDVFGSYTELSSFSLVMGLFFFSMQIYGDFSGYSDVAIGTGRLFGFRLMRNFANPYFSRDIAEFWRRWHISLSTWFRDYLYIPLGGSRAGRWRSMRNIAIVFVVSGFWHGANWTFIVWGALHALLFVPLFLGGANRDHLDVVAAGRTLPSLGEAVRMGVTFSLTCLAWVFFRSPSVGSALDYLAHIATASPIHPLRLGANALVLSVVMMGWEWVQREKEHGLVIAGLSRPLRNVIYLGLIFLIIHYSDVQRDFIYFQF